jgi:putative oxidoreductase
VFEERSVTEVWVPRALAVLRIVAGYLFLQHGSAKLLGVPSVAAFEHVTLLSLVGVAGVLELAGGAMLIVGWLVRPVAFVLSGQMAVAYFIAHAAPATILSPLLNRGEGAVLYCFIFLFLAVAGGGAWSIDSLRHSRAARGTFANA